RPACFLQFGAGTEPGAPGRTVGFSENRRQRPGPLFTTADAGARRYHRLPGTTFPPRPRRRRARPGRGLLRIRLVRGIPRPAGPRLEAGTADLETKMVRGSPRAVAGGSGCNRGD